MKYHNVKLRTYPLISFLRNDTYINLCNAFGLNPVTLRNSIMANKEREELTFDQWQKLMQEKPKRNL